MKNVDPSIIPNDEWDSMGPGGQLLTKVVFWLEDQENRINEMKVAAEAAGQKYKPSVYNRFISLVIETTIEPGIG
jgi:hypothetical protein